MNIIVYQDETDPDIRLAWPDTIGLRDLTDYTIAAEFINRFTGEIAFTKTTGITAGDGTGLSNVNIAFTAAELGDMVDHAWNMRVTATLGSERLVFTVNSRHSLPIIEVRAAPVAVP